MQRTGIGLVAEAHGTPIGFLLVLPLDGAAHILELAVERRWRGRGVGRLLLGAAEGWALQHGFQELTLITFRKPLWNAPSYAKIGFEGFAPGAGRFGLLDLLEAEARDASTGRPAWSCASG